MNEGVFTVPLDFGGAAFSGSARWLQIQVITNGGASVTTLVPRQALTATPYALYAANTAPVTAGNMPGGGAWTIASPLSVNSGLLHLDPVNSRVGIGTTSPAWPLDVKSDSSAAISNAILGEMTTTSGGSFSAAVRGTHRSTTGGGIGVHGSHDGHGFGVYGTAAGDFGIGVRGDATSTTGNAIGVYGLTYSPTGYAGYFIGGSNYFGGRIGISASQPAISLAIGNNTTGIESAGSSTLAIHTNGAERMRFSSDGNIGIGTNSPAAKMHVRGADEAIRVEGQSAGAANMAYISFHDALDARTGFVGDADNIDNATLLASTSGDVVLYTQGTRVVNVKPGGNVGIGTAAPAARLHVANGDMLAGESGEEWIFHTRTGFGGDFLHITDLSGGVPVFNRGLVIHENGNVGIGTVTPTSKLHVAGQITCQSTAFAAFSASTTTPQSSGSGVSGFALSDAGSARAVYGQCNSATGFDFYAGGAGTNYGAASSRRWKSNIALIDTPLEKLANVRGVYFDWDAEHGGHRDVGMIAEEVGKVLPEVVQYEQNGVDASGMDYSKLTPLLVEAVKALRAEKDADIEALRAEKEDEIASLRTEVNELERTVRMLLQQQNGARK
jgi:hypothetical protein